MEEFNMRRFWMLLVLLLVGIACLGFYQGWFKLSSEKGDQKSSVTFSVDENKLQKNEEKAKEELSDLGHKTKEKASDTTSKVEEPDRRP